MSLIALSSQGYAYGVFSSVESFIAAYNADQEENNCDGVYTLEETAVESTGATKLYQVLDYDGEHSDEMIGLYDIVQDQFTAINT